MGDAPNLARIVLQHAETSRLLGVPFVPVYRAGAAGPADSAGASQDVSEPDHEPAAPAIAARPARPSAQDRRDVPAPPSFGGEPPPMVRPVVTGLEIKPRSRQPGDVQAALDELRERYELDAPHRHFKTDHHSIVFGEGAPCARLMFVGEAPGAEEDRTGRPFVGRAGQLLDKMIKAMGLSREEVYIANVLKTRPPDNATPTSDEIRLCAPYLFQQIAIVHPQAIVTLGLPATRALLDTTDSMSRLRGRWAQFHAPSPAAAAIPVMPTYHPAFLLRSYTEENRAKVWSDLQQVMKRLSLGPTPAQPA